MRTSQTAPLHEAVPPNYLDLYETLIARRHEAPRLVLPAAAE